MSEQRDYPAKPAKAYFFGTCIIDLLYPEAGVAAMQLIRREGVEVIFPHNQTCCGQPAWNSGYREDALEVALQQLKCFHKDYPVVVPSASCAGMLKHHYPEMFQDHPAHQQAVAFAGRVFEFSEFMVHVLRVDLKDLGQPVRVALHTSCSARREMAVGEEHKQLLQRLDKVELVEPVRCEECCGFGGTFSVKHADVSVAMVQDKAEAIAATGASRLVSGDCGCLMNISGHMEHRGDRTPAEHIASFVWERTQGAQP